MTDDAELSEILFGERLTIDRLVSEVVDRAELIATLSDRLARYERQVGVTPSRTDVVTDLWRCSECGKWSHAKRRPRRHERFIHIDDPLPHNADVIDERPEEVDYNGDLIRPGGHMVRCGPFWRWVTVRAEGTLA